MIEINGLSKWYGPTQVLRQINLQLEGGQIIGYIGPNGAGKSTTVKILTGLIQDYEGEIRIGEYNLRKDLARYKSVMGYVPETAELYELLTPREYLSFIGKLYRMSKERLQEKLDSLLKLFSMEAHVDQRMDGFSKGMKQKILLISALLHDPEVLFLDEPLSGLDANAVILVKELLQKLKAEGKTIFYCSHMMDVVEKVSDRIVLINQGQILLNETAEELRQRGNHSLESIFAELTRPISTMVTENEN